MAAGIYCKNCGDKITPGSRFCAKCGSPVLTEPPYIETPPPSRPSVSPASAAYYPPVLASIPEWSQSLFQRYLTSQESITRAFPMEKKFLFGSALALTEHRVIYAEKALFSRKAYDVLISNIVEIDVRSQTSLGRLILGILLLIPFGILIITIPIGIYYILRSKESFLFLLAAGRQYAFYGNRVQLETAMREIRELQIARR